MAPARSRDPGLQPERTGLAWWRTSLSMLAVALLGLRTALVADSAPALMAAVIGGAAAVVMLRVGGDRPTYHPDHGEVASRGSRRTVVGIAAAVIAIAALQIVHMAVRAHGAM